MARHNALLLASAVALAAGLSACGGGGGSGLASTPPPPPTPPPPTPPPDPGAAIIPAATSSQQFISKGVSYGGSVFMDFETGDPLPVPTTDDSEQVDVRYNATSGFYEVEFPHDGPGWRPLGTPAGANSGHYVTENGAVVFDLGPKQQYSALLAWTGMNSFGATAIGIPTFQLGVPTTGSAIYNGQLYGFSSEGRFDGMDGHFTAGISGSILLNFNFGSGSLSGSISPTLLMNGSHPLGTINFTNTVYSTGSTNFSGSFDTNLTGLNSFSGLFTGPNAQELIGNFAFPYTSPVDGRAQQAAGAFMARQP